MNISKKVLFNVASIILFLLIITVVSMKPMELNKKLETKNIVVTCQAQNEKCSISVKDLSFTIQFDKNIYYLKPFSFSVRVKEGHDIKIDSIHANFKMTNMDMGVNRFKLNSVNSSQTDGVKHWQGKALLPVCVTGRADWVSEIEVLTGNNKRYIFILPLEVKN